MNPIRRELLIRTVALAGGFAGGGAVAQDVWPSKPIRIISPGAAGGGSDIFVRIVEPRLRERLGQGLFIENHPGAGGMTGAAVANSARPDGYTFFVSNVATNGIGVSLYRKPTFDPKKDLPAVARIATLARSRPGSTHRPMQRLSMRKSRNGQHWSNRLVPLWIKRPLISAQPSPSSVTLRFHQCRNPTPEEPHRCAPRA